MTSRFSRRSESGSVLMMSLVLLLLLATTLSALLFFAQVSLRSGVAYRHRGERVVEAEDGTDLAIAHMRSERSRGSESFGPVEMDYREIRTTCLPATGSGNGTADREVTCTARHGFTATEPGRAVLITRVRFLDGAGRFPGRAVEILSTDYP